MLFDSVKYNLTNPVFTEDIGESYMNRMFPMTSGISGGGMDFDDLSMQPQLKSDKVEITSKKQKNKKTWKTIFIIAGVALLGVLGFKYGKKFGSTIWNSLKSLGSTIKAKFKK
jgi:hypothetical protein